jgi:hypothetical protein
MADHQPELLRGPAGTLCTPILRAAESEAEGGAVG